MGDVVGQRSIRFPEDLAARIEAEAKRLDRSFSWVVLQLVREAFELEDETPRALGQALRPVGEVGISSGSQPANGGSTPSAGSAASARASVPEEDVVEYEPRHVSGPPDVEAPSVPRIARRHWAQ